MFFSLAHSPSLTQLGGSSSFDMADCSICA